MESETQGLDRRTFLKATGVAVAAASIPSCRSTSRTKPSGSVRAAEGGLPEKSTGEHRGRIFKSIKFGMFREKLSYVEKFQLLKDLGYDGVELNSPKGENKEKALAARRAGKRRVILSRENESDLRDLPDYVKDDMEFILVETVEDVLKDALLPCSRRARWPKVS